MRKPRICARLDIKNGFVIKGMQLEGLRKIGDPNELAIRYATKGCHEIILMDAVASHYGRNSLVDIVRVACENVFVPLTVGGGLRSLQDVTTMLRAGADKVALNTAIVKKPGLITEITQQYGSQCLVASIEAKFKRREKRWEIYIDNGREPTGIDVMDWAEKVQLGGAGEIMLTSVDRDGTRRGFDLPLIEKVNAIVDIPVVASGGAGKMEHIKALGGMHPRLSGIALGAALHYELFTISDAEQTFVDSLKGDSL